jgi:hypothetical protein
MLEIIDPHAAHPAACRQRRTSFKYRVKGVQILKKGPHHAFPCHSLASTVLGDPMRMLTAVAICIYSLMMGGQVFAQSQVLTTVTPQQVATVLQTAGYRASVLNENGSTFVKSSMSGVTVFVDFPGCTNNNCVSLVFHAIWNDPSLNVNFANSWNAAWRYAKAYIDDKGYFHFMFDVNLDGGVTSDNIRQDAVLYDYLLGQLLKFSAK